MRAFAQRAMIRRMTVSKDRVEATAPMGGTCPGGASRGSGASPAEPCEVRPVGATETRRPRGERVAMLESIFAATEQIILEKGTDHLSIIDVCHSAGVSRGTFYRNFASLDELLDAYVQHRREVFRRTLAERLAPCTDPRWRLDAVLDFLGSALSSGQPRQLLIAAPEFALVIYKSLFFDAMVHFQDVLAPVLDDWSRRLGAELDRALVCELLVRFAMSEALIGRGPDLEAMPRRVARMVEMLRSGCG